MNFTYKKETNVEIGQKLYGIIATSIYSCHDVYPIVVDYVDYNDELVIFAFGQPGLFICCDFDNMNAYVFESEEEAKSAMDDLDSDEGMYAY